MKISLCITTFNRYEMCEDCLADVIDDDRIDDIVIMDDCSTNMAHMKLLLRFGQNKKIKIRTQLQNVGMSKNKRDAISFAKNEWAIIFDDDNKMGPDYLDALFEVDGLFVNKYDIFMPDFAKPNFDYRNFDDANIYSGNINQWTAMPRFGAMINTCNYVVNRDFYLDAWVYNQEMKATDTAWHAYNHLKAGGAFYVVPGMTYEHRVHDESGFMKDVHYNMAQSGRIGELIKKLK